MSLCVFNAGDKKVRVARMKQKLMAVASAAVILTAVAIPNKAGLGRIAQEPTFPASHSSGGVSAACRLVCVTSRGRPINTPA
jgi:hypothetical protein